MSISETIIKVFGIILAAAGLFIVLGAAQALIGAVTMGSVVAIVVGALMIGAGVFIVRGGNITA